MKNNIKNFNEKKLNIKKILILIAILLIIIAGVISTTLYIKNSNFQAFVDKYLFRKNAIENNLPVISNDSQYVYAFNDNILELHKNVLTFYNKNGAEIASLDIQIINPIVHTNGNYFVIAENQGQKLYLISGKHIVWEKSIEGNISDVYVNKNGYISIVISGTTYKSIVQLFSNEGNELFKNYLSNSYIMDFAISPDNNYLALAEANLSGTIIKSNIRIIDINKASTNSSESTIYNSQNDSSNLILNIDYIKNNQLACIYDNKINVIIDNNIKEVSTLENTIFADINNQIIKIQKNNTNLFSSTFDLQIIDSSTLENVTYSLEDEPKTIKVFDNIIVVNFGTEALFIHNSGWLLKHYTSSQEIQDISISDDLAAIIYKDKTEIISL